MNEARVIRGLERVARMLTVRDRSVPIEHWMELCALEIDDLIEAIKNPRPEGLVNVADLIPEVMEQIMRRRERTAKRRAI